MNPQLHYLRDVLGIESWIGSTSVEVNTRPRLTVIGRKSWSGAERAMVDKILAAVGVSAPFADQSEIAGIRSPHLLVFDSEAPVGRQSEGDQTSWCLGPLQKLLVGTADEIQNCKRDVWNLLKSMKDQLSQEVQSD